MNLKKTFYWIWEKGNWQRILSDSIKERSEQGSILLDNGKTFEEALWTMSPWKPSPFLLEI